MTSESLKSVQVHVAGRTYPVRVDINEESYIHRLEKQVNDKIKEFKLNYQDLDALDCVSMTLLTFAFDLQKSRNVALDQKIMERMNELEELLDKALQ